MLFWLMFCKSRSIFKQMPDIKLQSSDGEMFSVEEKIAKQSIMIKTMLEGLDNI